MRRVCSVEGCDAPARARGWCNKHLLRWRRHGDPSRQPVTALDRFWQNVVKRSSGCWTWTGRADSFGYGRISIEGRYTGAHRFAYETFVGPVPEGLELDHLCRTRLCVNPAHLEPVTHAENMERARVARTHCRHGHPVTEENTYTSPTTGHRSCRVCRQERRKSA